MLKCNCIHKVGDSMKEETKVYHVNEIQEGLIGDCLTKVIAILEERGYDAMTQLVGYLSRIVAMSFCEPRS